MWATALANSNWWRHQHSCSFLPCRQGTCPFRSPCSASTDELADAPICSSAGAHEQTQIHIHTDRLTQQQQQQSSPSRQTSAVTQPHMTSDHLLVSCNNSGAVRVLSLPAVASPVASQDDEQMLQSGQQAAKLDEDVWQNPVPCTNTCTAASHCKKHLVQHHLSIF